MIKPSEIISCFVLVRDFVRFSHSYEGDQTLKEYALQEFGIDVSSANALLTGLAKEATISHNNYYNAIDTIEQVMPFTAAVPSPVRSHFEQRDVGAVAYFAPERLFSGKINIPEAVPLDCSGVVKMAIRYVKEYITGSLHKGISVNALLSVLEDWCSYFSLDSGRTSFFEFLKLKAGNATIILHSMAEQTFSNSLGNNTVLTCSFDFLGIKDFKFQELFENDLHLMKAASLYIDLFRENVLDEFLDVADLTRANVIFCGGRHIHLYLPDTSCIKQIIPQFIAKINDWCVGMFKTQLYVSYGYESTIGNALLTDFREKDLYLDTFVSIANMKADVESAKYTPANIATINDLNNNDFLSFKKTFRTLISSLSKMMLDSSDLRINVCELPTGLPVFPGKYILLGDEQCKIFRSYISNTSFKERLGSDVGIWMNLTGFDRSFSELTRLSAFPSFVGVLRADIDDFRKEMLMYGERKATYLRDPISEMMLSKEFAIFLRYYIYLLAQKYAHIVVLHEGADDVFVVGSVEDILAFSEEFAHTYRLYTNNCMTISAGISIYAIGNRFISAANEAQELMNISKAVPGKNAITAFFSDSVVKWSHFNCTEYLGQLSSKEY